MNPLYADVARRAQHRCEYCRAPEVIFNCRFEVEHIIPSAKQGPNQESNFARACRFCNLRKSDHLQGHDQVFHTEARLFHPRNDDWHVHFEVNIDTGEIRGLTSTGRATINRLEMNAALQLQARQQWMKLGLYP